MVVNAPQSNIVSAAELAVGLLLAAARHVPAASAALKQGEWQRSRFTGVELYEKTAGIVGLGRIGVLVAQRLSAFGMQVIAYDPYVAPARAAQMGVRLVPLDELLRESDVDLRPPAQDAGDGRADRRRAARPRQAVGHPRQRGAGRHRRRGRALRSAQGRPGRRRGHRRLRHRAVHGLPAVRPRVRGGDAAPRCQHRRGAGEGRRRGRPVGSAGARRRAGARRGQRPGRASSPRTCGRASRWSRSSAGCSRRWPAASPAQLAIEVRGDITRHDVRVLELAALKGLFQRHHRGPGVLRERAAARRASGASRSRSPPTPSRRTTAT